MNNIFCHVFRNNLLIDDFPVYLNDEPVGFEKLHNMLRGDFENTRNDLLNHCLIPVVHEGKVFIFSNITDSAVCCRMFSAIKSMKELAKETSKSKINYEYSDGLRKGYESSEAMLSHIYIEQMRFEKVKIWTDIHFL